MSGIKSINEHDFSCMLIAQVEIESTGYVSICDIHDRWTFLTDEDLTVILNAKGFDMVKRNDKVEIE